MDDLASSYSHLGRFAEAVQPLAEVLTFGKQGLLEKAPRSCDPAYSVYLFLKTEGNDLSGGCR